MREQIFKTGVLELQNTFLVRLKLLSYHVIYSGSGASLSCVMRPIIYGVVLCIANYLLFKAHDPLHELCTSLALTAAFLLSTL